MISKFLHRSCAYKFLYVWLDDVALEGTVIKNPGWNYCLPNPLLPFTWFRVSIPREHSAIPDEEYECAT